jgi:hypothetical protein
MREERRGEQEERREQRVGLEFGLDLPFVRAELIR